MIMMNFFEKHPKVNLEERAKRKDFETDNDYMQYLKDNGLRQIGYRNIQGHNVRLSGLELHTLPEEDFVRVMKVI